MTDEQARDTALTTVARYRSVDRDFLAVTSVEFADRDTVLVELRHVAGGGHFTVELRCHNGSVRMARVRKISEPNNPSLGDG